MVFTQRFVRKFEFDYKDKEPVLTSEDDEAVIVARSGLVCLALVPLMIVAPIASSAFAEDGAALHAKKTPAHAKRPKSAATAPSQMQYRVQFLDSFDNVIREVRAEDRSARTVLFRRGINRACPPHGVRMRVLDPYGRASVSRNLGRALLA